MGRGREQVAYDEGATNIPSPRSSASAEAPEEPLRILFEIEGAQTSHRARTGPKGKVFGFDITDAMIEKARANIERMGAKNVKILKGDATKIPLDNSSVDVVTSNGVLNLVPEKGKAFHEIYRVLKPGGKIQISDIVVQSNIQKVCGLIPQLWADCIGGAAVEGEYVRTIKEPGFGDVRVIKRLDYFASSPSENTKRLTKTFGAESVVITGSKPKNN